MTRARSLISSWSGVALMAWAVALGACGPEPPAPPAPSPEQPAQLTRLWLREPVQHVQPGADDVGSLRFDARFDGARVFFQACTPEPAEGVDPREAALAFESRRPNRGLLTLPYRENCYGLVAVVPVRPGEAFSVTVSGRDVRPNVHRRLDTGQLREEQDDYDVVFVAELKERFDPERVWSLEEVTGLRDPRRHAHHVLEVDPAERDGYTVSSRFVTDRRTRTLLVQLLAPNTPGAPPRVFERLEVRRHELAGHLASGGGVPGLRELAALPGDDARPIDGSLLAQLDRDERAALLAMPGTRYAWSLPALAEPRRLDLSLGLLPRDASFEGETRLRVRVKPTAALAEASAGPAAPAPTRPVAPGDAAPSDAGDAGDVDGWFTLLDESHAAPVRASDAAWHDRVLELPASPGGPLQLELSASGTGDQPPLAFFGHPTVYARVGPRRPNVVLISLDTLRPDRLGCYGGDASLSPNLDAFAAEGLRWERAWSTSSYTLPSHASMMTGQFPAYHGAVNIDDAINPKASPLLAAMLAREGWATAAFTGGGYVDTTYGFGVGFDRYSTNDPVWAYDALRGRMLLDTMSWEREPLEMELLRRYDVGSIERWIEGRADQGPFFLFLHTYIVHNYAPSLEWLGRMGLLSDGPVPERAFDHKPRTAFNEGEHELLDDVYEQYMPYYDATIGMADEFVGRVLGALEAAGVDEDTLVIITSDHGEEFGEHGFFGHGETLYDANTRVPFLARLPGPRDERVGRVIETPVSLADIAPWVLRRLDLQPDRRMVVEAPLAPDVLDPPGRSLLFVELDNQLTRRAAIVRGDHKLSVHLEQEREPLPVEARALYDLANDPGETVDLDVAQPELVDELRGTLDGFHQLAQQHMPRIGGATDYSDMTVDQLQTLAALGYLTVEDLDRILAEMQDE